jgi:hypothetical protein
MNVQMFTLMVWAYQFLAVATKLFRHCPTPPELRRLPTMQRRYLFKLVFQKQFRAYLMNVRLQQAESEEVARLRAIIKRLQGGGGASDADVNAAVEVEPEPEPEPAAATGDDNENVDFDYKELDS